MAQHFGSLVFTPAVKALQERYGSRKRYARMEESGTSFDRLGPDEGAFISERDSFYMASAGASGWPYVQHRGGQKGFLKVIDDSTLAFADFRGNKQYISTGNLTTNDRVALIMIDYPRQARLKILARVEIFEGGRAAEWTKRVEMPGEKAVIERVLVLHVEAFDWNCPQHITPRYTAEEIQSALEPVEREMRELKAENERLRKAVGLAGQDEETPQ